MKRIAILGALALAALLTAQPPTTSWPTYHGDYSGKRYSKLTQINQSNVKNLTLAWTSRLTGGAGGAGGIDGHDGARRPEFGMVQAEVLKGGQSADGRSDNIIRDKQERADDGKNDRAMTHAGINAATIGVMAANDHVVERRARRNCSRRRQRRGR